MNYSRCIRCLVTENQRNLGIGGVVWGEFSANGAEKTLPFLHIFDHPACPICSVPAVFCSGALCGAGTAVRVSYSIGGQISDCYYCSGMGSTPKSYQLLSTL